MSIKTAAVLKMASARMIDVQFKDLSYEVRIGYRGEKKHILKDLDGLFKAGELTAIMGPSGAGKSTLLNVLSGFLHGRLAGTVEYVSTKGKQNWNKCKKQSCYIQQLDYLYDQLTVQESMIITAYLKIGSGATHQYRQKLVDGILDALNLSKAKDTRAVRLSGGQKKRLSIAFELIDNPPIMFLDEPTTGLDSLASLQCVTALQTLAKGGRAVICTIHQPSAALYQMFDHVYLVANGQCMYAGAPDNTVDYFAHQGFQCPKYHNPADYMLELVSHEHGNHDSQLIAAAKQFCRREETPMKLRIFQEASFDGRKSRIGPPSEATRFWVLLRRCALLMSRDWTMVHLKLILHVFVSIILGLLFQHVGNDGSKTVSNLSYLIIYVLYLMYTTLIPAVVTFPLELAILRKERFNNWYQLKTYYAAVLVIGIPLHVIFTFSVAAISYVLSSQPLEWSRFSMFLFVGIMTSFTSETVGLGYGTLFNPVNGTFVGAITACVMLLLGGFLIMFRHMPATLYYISYANFCRFAYEAVVQAMYGYQREKLSCYAEYCHFQIPSMILEEMDMVNLRYWVDVAVLFGWFVVLRTMTYVSLKKCLSKI